MVQNKSTKVGKKMGKKFGKGKKNAGGGYRKDGGNYKQNRTDGKKNLKPKGGGKEEEGSDFEEVATSIGTASQPQKFEVESDGEEQPGSMQKLVQQQNRKKKKSGGFQAMGLSKNVFLGVTRKGYKVPTPIQRKTVPIIMDGKDVVAMARTGSGKTAAFLVPMLERLKVHSTQGARALIMSPTRELALQTLKFAKELGKYTNLKCAVILGGDSMENQFAALHENPDIIIATPGRFMHVVVEMNLKLQTVEYVVFDEADRLFEMGFEGQLTEVLKRLPEDRQTLLFSATLPKLLVDFAQAGLHDPTLVRLDVDTKLSPNLKMSFVSVRSVDRLAVLMHLLKNVIKPKQQTVVFAATKHHVEYLNMVLKEIGIECSYTYSALDPTARKINVAKFQHRKTRVLIVTDLAARGIDIPLLDNVINFNFPAKPKLFVHRVGRVARAGNSGTAYSLVGPDELPFVLDLHLFLGRSLKVAKAGHEDEDGLFGRVPQRVMDDEEENIRRLQGLHDISSMMKVIDNAYRKYLQSRPAPASESIKRSKDFRVSHLPCHPLFGETSDPSEEEARSQLLESMKSYRPNNTIFEINATNKTKAFEVMKVKRGYHDDKIQMVVAKQQESSAREEEEESRSPGKLKNSPEESKDISTEELKQVFSRVVAPKRPATDKVFEPKKKKRKFKPKIDEENYLHYRPKDFESEKGLSLGTSFETEAAKAVMDISGMDSSKNKNEGQMRWDRKKKKFVRMTDDKQGKKWVKTESGVWIPSSYKTNVYKDWLNKSKKGVQDDDSDDDAPRVARKQDSGRFEILGGAHRRGKGFHQVKEKKEGKRPELKRKEQILKARKTNAKKMHFDKRKEVKRSKRKNMKH